MHEAERRNHDVIVSVYAKRLRQNEGAKQSYYKFYCFMFFAIFLFVWEQYNGCFFLA